MPIIGAHVSAAGGLYKCFANAEEIGATALQIFGASPRGWKAPLPSEEVIEQFRVEQKRSGLGPVFLHAAYLVNLGTHNSKLWHASLDNLAAHLAIAGQLGAAGLIFHLGSSKGWGKNEAITKVVEGMKRVLDKVPGETKLIMENAAGGGDKIGSTLEEIGEIFTRVKDPRVKVCIDTQHAFAAGLLKDFSADEISKFVQRCNIAFGWKQVIALHANDSKSESGSHYDRHENIGEGYIGIKGFRHLAQHPKIHILPWILEVPGFTNTGPDKKNIDRLKKLCVS